MWSHVGQALQSYVGHALLAFLLLLVHSSMQATDACSLTWLCLRLLSVDLGLLGGCLRRGPGKGEPSKALH